MAHTILGQKTHPLGGFYLARTETGEYVAGTGPDRTHTFDTAQDVYDHYHPLAVEQGQHWAWNICYCIEDEIRAAE